ncbi:esterase-like activity of phytase family protein [Parvularcula sp. LCG005]|uniref:esterase-like activity of phytase family protein n=1 Tax=Parvularcula sp. LCG005 TaxID=3078805 RepID=UPI002942D492|nr:esterase-like activity of phytase family protein [Parvularcula sp. LCG005]WOI54531.1 esterase-like activity of phytase family protein [Parvularcula sp. LCG005]
MWTSLLALLALDPLAINLRVERFPVLDDQAIVAHCVTLERGFTLFGSNGFGGVSAMRIADDRAIAVTDVGTVFDFDLQRDAAGFVSAFGPATPHYLLDTDGERLNKANGDSEGLILLDDRTALISFENMNRIDRYHRAEGDWHPDATIFETDDARLGRNDGFETIVQLADGRVMALAEGKGADGWSPLWISHHGLNGPWRESAYQAADEFNPTDADIDPATGDLIVLERAFSRTKGVRARLVRVPAGDLDKNRLIGTELARMSFLHGIDNMEAIEVERAPDGRLIAHLMSDDNFNDIQRTVFLGISIAETPECGAK